MTQRAISRGPNAPAAEQGSPVRDEAGKLLMVMNGALVGVPAAYAVSNSLPVTVAAVILAMVMVIVCLPRRAR